MDTKKITPRYYPASNRQRPTVVQNISPTATAPSASGSTYATAAACTTASSPPATSATKHSFVPPTNTSSPISRNA